MTITIIRSLPDFQQPNESTDEAAVILRYSQPDTTMLLSPEVPSGTFGKGTIYVTESQVYFFSPETSTGLAIEYPSIVMHAVSREESSGSCVYCQLSDSIHQLFIQASQGQNGENEEDEIDDDFTELRFVPNDAGAVDAIFEAMSECAALHPDFVDEEEFYEDDEEMLEEGQFDDAPEN
ncbi:hypothetical protein K493DRAFT_314187 [Basidiobolus meristosporus CBS 931.73]|uniref:Methylosome subunit pICln n=1 Tax=Basidiobolus meristosporus CBS 931.73 TaxID=1314790 RepID=A0A1Y1YGV3_9FUNG|nr:hypothetical protein K493DRAFT_314187 [Basidiobolus meristosporus CBS 931.73]|eukprot:ORX97215.1 hypothetical protein K493DRAFT_314187 [Basidiobolus meristosporus CBS 931.73]